MGVSLAGERNKRALPDVACRKMSISLKLTASGKLPAPDLPLLQGQMCQCPRRLRRQSHIHYPREFSFTFAILTPWVCLGYRVVLELTLSKTCGESQTPSPAIRRKVSR